MVHQFKHGRVKASRLSLHYAETGAGDPVILVPGWPQTWFAWRAVMPLLAAAGHRAIAFDPPGMGESDFLPEGQTYDTGRIADLLHDAVLALKCDPVVLVGHDVGAWISFAYASRHQATVRQLVLLDGGVPGLMSDAVFSLRNASNIFQFFFNAVPELPELLTCGRERKFLSWFFRTKSFDPNLFKNDDLDEYTRVYSHPARMTAGFNYYRAVPMDIEQNKKADRLTMPTLALGAEKGLGMALHASLLRQADLLEGGQIDRCGHYIPEERPDAWSREFSPSSVPISRPADDIS
jgi:pimeloyl-ACP methyl ester carboxylesterase